MALAARETGISDPVIMFVVQPGERNSYDQQVAFVAICSQAHACNQASTSAPIARVYHVMQMHSQAPQDVCWVTNCRSACAT